MKTRGMVLCLALVGGLAACEAGPPGVEGPDTRLRLDEDLRLQPPRQDDRRCWHRWEQPALFETVTEQVLIVPPVFDAAGRMVTPAVFRSVTQQREIRPRRPTWFRIPCEADLAGDPAVFTASLQRALKARGFYGGDISGVSDSATRASVMAFQRRLGLESDMLSFAAARALGLISSVAQ
jgi:hypothetical protein